MINGTQELLLTEFFMHQAVLGPFLKNGEKLFGLLGKIFMFSKDGAESLFKLACCEAAGEITSQKDFMLHKRMKKFLKMQGGRESESDGDEAAEIKGNAL